MTGNLSAGIEDHLHDQGGLVVNRYYILHMVHHHPIEETNLLIVDHEGNIVLIRRQFSGILLLVKYFRVQQSNQKSIILHNPDQRPFLINQYHTHQQGHPRVRPRRQLPWLSLVKDPCQVTVEESQTPINSRTPKNLKNFLEDGGASGISKNP